MPPLQHQPSRHKSHSRKKSLQVSITGPLYGECFVNCLILVTGANRGIGLGIAECCLVNGAEKIYSIDLAEPGEEFHKLAKLYPGRLFALQANVTKEASVQEAVDKILVEAGGLHGMVCNAGRTNHKSALDFTTEEIEALFNVNVSRIRV